MRKVIMIGPDRFARGGMSTVIDIYLRSGYEADGRCQFLRTQCQGSFLRRSLVLIHSLMVYLGFLLSGRMLLLHAHVASGKSFWRKSIFICLAYIFRRPVIFHLHGGEFAQFVEERIPPWRKKFVLAVIAKADQVFALTLQAERWLLEVGNAKNVLVLPNPMIVPPRGNAPNRGKDVLFIGGIQREKGIYDLLDAFKMVLFTIPDARLVVCGAGDTAGVKASAQAIGIERKLHFAGWVNEAERNAWLASAGVYVLPSHFEQMPMSVLEAMAAGCPVVATRVAAVPEILDHQVSGRLVDVGDVSAMAAEIVATLSNSLLSQQLADEAYAVVSSRYEASRVVGQLKGQYTKYSAKKYK
ncbi:glycosyltransferase family 4 protein [Roseateles albus]|uniref:Glycosyltransferase family 4 protein n=1 Tax=Roseateles albus TaxID=2987525 RepID=A0ABT5KDU3_9BURK|nr:glycosyltransferase family 4 protein [Roseateles albus]MDC8772086.1 glycosyltransferase family 4 protein [Roseateles albus]